MKWTKAVFLSVRDNIVHINTISLKLTDETAQALVSSIGSKVPNMLHRRIGCLNASLNCDLDARKMNKTAQAFCEISSWFETIKIELCLRGLWTPASRESLISGLRSMPDQTVIKVCDVRCEIDSCAIYNYI
jgi:hypothetical protein